MAKQLYYEHIPHLAQGYSHAATACIELNDFVQAEILYIEGQKKAPTSAEPWIQFAECSMRQQLYGEALQRWAILREKFPNHPRGYSRAAAACIELNDFAQAETLCIEGQKKAPTSAEPWIQFAECSMRRKQFTKALELWATIRNKFPYYIRGYTKAIEIYILQQQYEQANTLCSEVLLKLKNLPKQNLIPILFNKANIISANQENILDAIKFLLKIYHRDKFYQNCNEFIKKFFSIFIKYLIYLSKNNIKIINSKIVIYIISLLINDNKPQLCRFFFLFIFRTKKYFSKQDIYTSIKHAIIKYKIKSNIANIFDSSNSLKQNQSLLNLICSKQKGILCILEIIPERINLFKEVIDKIIYEKQWESFDRFTLFYFIRLVNFFDQDKANTLIVQALYNSSEKKLNNPMGLLNFRYNSQKNFFNFSTKTGLITNRKLNIALCISGQLRGYELCLINLLKAFDFANHNTKIFVHTWENVGRKFPTEAHAYRSFTGKFLYAYQVVVHGKDIEKYLQTNYINFYNLFFSKSLVSTDKLKKFYNTNNVIVENDTLEPFNLFSNSEKMYYKIYRSINMPNSNDYDLVIRTRPDLYIKSNNVINLLKLYKRSKSNSSVFINKNFLISEFEYAVDDNFAIGIPHIMKIYSNTYKDMTNLFWKNNSFNCPPKLCGHYSLEYQLFAHGIKIEFLRDLSFSFKDPDLIPITSIYEALKKDIEKRKPTEDDKILIQACIEDMHK